MAREVAERAGVSTVVQPRMDRVGRGFLVAARVEDTAEAKRVQGRLRERGFDPIHAMAYPAAHFELGRLTAAMGEPERAREHYAAFLDAFTDPDPEYAWMVEEARGEVDRLGHG